MSEVQKTTDYEIFAKHPSNRNIDNSNLKKIVASIKARNLLAFRPILVNANMQIIDGQHRLEAAKLLGLEVFYQMQKECTHEDIVILNSNQKVWKIEDYMDYYISLGNQEYLKLKEYITSNNIGLNFTMKIMCGLQHAGYDAIRNGSFKFFKAEDLMRFATNSSKTEECLKVLLTYIISHNSFLKADRFKMSLIRFFDNEDVDFQVFLTKIRVKADAFRPCAEVTSYLEMFKQIYNWKNQNPLT